MGRMNVILFRAICISFSLLLLVSALLGAIRLAALSEELNTLETSLKALKEENRVLHARVESSLSLEELERRAIEELGMQRLSPGQIIYIDLE